MRLARILSAWRGDGDERRHEARRAEARVAVDSPAVEVALVDTSVSGLGVETERRLRIGVIYPFRLRHDGRVSMVYGLVRWCQPSDLGGFRSGISVATTVPRSSRFAPIPLS